MYGFEDTHCVLPMRIECEPDGHTVQCAALSPCWLTLRAFFQSLSFTILSWTTISIHFSTRLIIHLTKYPQWKLARMGLTQSHWLQPPPLLPLPSPQSLGWPTVFQWVGRSWSEGLLTALLLPLSLTNYIYLL